MENIVSTVLGYIEALAANVSLEWFTFIGSFIEEVFAPIPSPFVLSLAGSITAAQNRALPYIFVVALIGATAKLLGGILVYVLADKTEDLIVGKFGKFFGIKHTDIEKLGKMFNKSKKDFVTLFALRSIPLVPSSPISAVTGLIKLNFRTFVVATFTGNIVRNLFFLYLGYTGLSASEDVASGIESMETVGKILFLGALGVGLFILWKKRQKGNIFDMANFSKDDKAKEAKDLLNYKEVSELPKEESDELPTLYIFRHGQTEDNANYIFSGWRDSPITETGKQQAEVLAEKLKDKKLDVLISSPQIRAVDTMKIAVSKNPTAKDLPIETDERIKERSYGDYQGKSKMEIQMEDPEKLQKIRRGYSEVPPNGESIGMVCKRVASFCEDIVKRMKEENINVAVSCHGNSMRGFREYFEHLAPEEVEKLETPLGQDYAAYVIR